MTHFLSSSTESEALRIGDPFGLDSRFHGNDKGRYGNDKRNENNDRRIKHNNKESDGVSPLVFFILIFEMASSSKQAPRYSAVLK